MILLEYSMNYFFLPSPPSKVKWIFQYDIFQYHPNMKIQLSFTNIHIHLNLYVFLPWNPKGNVLCSRMLDNRNQIFVHAIEVIGNQNGQI